MKNIAVPLAEARPTPAIRATRAASTRRIGTSCLVLVARYLCWATRNNR